MTRGKIIKLMVSYGSRSSGAELTRMVFSPGAPERPRPGGVQVF